MKVIVLQGGENLVRHWGKWYTVQPITGSPWRKLNLENK